MPLYWVAQNGQQVGQAISQEGQQFIAAGLAAAGWIIAAGAAWWYGSSGSSPSFPPNMYFSFCDMNGTIIEVQP